MPAQFRFENDEFLQGETPSGIILIQPIKKSKVF
jgi:hypothetical protein